MKKKDWTTGITIMHKENPDSGTFAIEQAFFLVPVFYMILGVYGWMKTLLGIIYPPMEPKIFYAGILFFGIWFGMLYAARKYIMPLVILTLAGFAGTIVLRFSAIREGVLLVENEIFRTMSQIQVAELQTSEQANREGNAVTFLLCVTFLLFCFFLFALFSELGQYMAILLMALIIAANFALNQLPDMAGTCCMLFSAIGLTVSGATEQTRARSKGALVMGILAAAMLLMGNFVVRPMLAPMFSDSEIIRTEIQNTSLIQTLSKHVPQNLPDFSKKTEDAEVTEGTGTASVIASGGTSSGELNAVDSFSYTGEIMATVTTTNQPENTIYLKSYIGNAYTGTSWTPSMDDAPVRDVFYERASSAAAENGITEPAVLQVGDTEDELEPYYSMTAGIENSFYYYDLNYREALQVSASDDRTDDYRQIVYANDLSWPSDRLPDYEQYVAEHPCSSVEEIIQQVVGYLDEAAVYDLNVGRFPENQDFAEYFLYQKKAGYCVHFATAAALLFRMYGIPSRYVSGYLVPAGSFEQTADGSWRAEIPDSRAHAWPEIYLNGLGWVPVEATPSSGDPAQSGTSAENKKEQETQETEAAAKSDAELTEQVKDQYKTTKTTPTLLWVAALIPALLFAAVLVLFTRRAWILRGRSCKNVTAIFQDMLDVLVIGGMPETMDCMNAEFSEKVVEQFVWIDKEELDRVLDIVMKASFSSEVMGKQQTMEVRGMYRHICRVLLKTMNRKQKFYFRFRDAYL